MQRNYKQKMLEKIILEYNLRNNTRSFFMNKERILAFTDAVVAIIMTIMVLEIKSP